MKKRENITKRKSWLIGAVIVGIFILTQAIRSVPDDKKIITLVSFIATAMFSFLLGSASVNIERYIKFKITIIRNTKEKNKANIDIITTFLDKQFDKNTIAVTGISIFIPIYILIHILLSKEMNYTIPVFLIIVAVMIVINQSLTIYRVKKQYFGTSYDEAREILYFVKKSKDKDSNNGKFIFTDEQPEIPSANEQTEYS